MTAMKGPQLIGQLIADAQLPRDEALRLATLANLAEAGRPLAAAARAAGLDLEIARRLARQFGMSFQESEHGSC